MNLDSDIEQRKQAIMNKLYDDEDKRQNNSATTIDDKKEETNNNDKTNNNVNNNSNKNDNNSNGYIKQKRDFYEKCFEDDDLYGLENAKDIKEKDEMVAKINADAKYYVLNDEKISQKKSESQQLTEEISKPELVIYAKKLVINVDKFKKLSNLDYIKISVDEIVMTDEK